MKNIFISFIILFFAFTSMFAKIILSTTEGGNYSDSSTWVGGQLPEESDELIIIGNVEVNQPGKVKRIKITEGAKFVINLNKGSVFHVSDTLRIFGELIVKSDSELKTDVLLREPSSHITNEGIIEVSMY